MCIHTYIFPSPSIYLYIYLYVSETFRQVSQTIASTQCTQNKTTRNKNNKQFTIIKKKLNKTNENNK